MLWVPEQDRALQVRLLVRGHMQEARHRKATETLQDLLSYCVQSGIEKRVVEFI